MDARDNVLILAADPLFLDHVPGHSHIESPLRLKEIYNRIAEPDLAGLYRPVSPRAAKFEELLWNHDRSLIEKVEASQHNDFTRFDPDTYACSSSWNAAIHAVGACFECLDQLVSGEATSAFALIRPPGHHAERDSARGFCLFNNIALAAHYAMRKLGAERVLIVDWDVHHGNGTQWSFYDSQSVLYFSTHQFPFYPGTGRIDEQGIDNGAGYTVNVPLASGTGDYEMSAVFNRLLVPVAMAYKPDFILVSAGFDIYEGDPLGGFMVSLNGISGLVKGLKKLAEELCPGRLLFCLEGGYSLYGLKEGVANTIKILAGDKTMSNVADFTDECIERPSPVFDIISNIQRAFSSYWSF